MKVQIIEIEKIVTAKEKQFILSEDEALLVKKVFGRISESEFIALNRFDAYFTRKGAYRKLLNLYSSINNEFDEEVFDN